MRRKCALSRKGEGATTAPLAAHAERQCRVCAADARRHVGIGIFLEVNSAGGTGHGDKLLTRWADQFAFCLAGG